MSDSYPAAAPLNAPATAVSGNENTFSFSAVASPTMDSSPAATPRFASARYEGRTAIVTGAASGIGRATARRLAAEGAAVGCVDLADAVDETAELITADGGTAIAVHVDVSDEASVADGVADVVDRLGVVTVLANVAGVLRFGITHQSSVADFDLQLAVNLKGPFLMARAVIPGMLDHGSGAITNVASSAGMFGQAYMPGYAASKGGVVMLTRAMAWEYQKLGIRVNAISPGGVDTNMTTDVTFPEGIDFELIKKTIAPDFKMMAPEQPAALIAFLCSDEAEAINGAVVPIDFGVTT
jgi:meso-butanediol dehydrogenase/(S,S)-butanediol dehydrogenase/diacetyl reductase